MMEDLRERYFGPIFELFSHDKYPEIGHWMIKNHSCNRKVERVLKMLLLALESNILENSSFSAMDNR